MKFLLEFDMDNDDFSYPKTATCAVFLGLARKINDGEDLKPGWSMNLMDSNGNTIGEAKIVDDTRKPNLEALRALHGEKPL